MTRLVKLLFLCLLCLNFSTARANDLNLLCDEGFTALQDLVQQPKLYKNKKVKIVGDFFSFSSLPLDYPQAFRDSKKYIGIVLSRPDQKQIPLVELKLAAKLELFKDEEKPIVIEHGDQVKINAKVFEVALGEPWLEISSIEIIRKNAEHG